MSKRTSVVHEGSGVEMSFNTVPPFTFGRYLPLLAYPEELGGIANVPIPVGAPDRAGYPYARALSPGGMLVWLCTGTIGQDRLAQSPDYPYVTDHAPVVSGRTATDDAWVQVHPSNALGLASASQMVPNVWHVWWQSILGIRPGSTSTNVVQTTRWVITRVFVHIPGSSSAPTLDVDTVVELMEPLSIFVRLLPLTASPS